MSPDGSGGLERIVEWLGADLGAAVEQVGFAACVLDTGGVVRWLNEAGVALVGDAVGMRFADLLAPETAGKARQEFAAKLLGTRSRSDYEAAVIGRDGRRVRVAISTVPLTREGQVVGVFGIARPADVAAAPAAASLDQLTPRQREVLGLLADGRSTRDIATELGLSPETVRNHVRQVLRRLGARTRLEAVLEAQRAAEGD
jgi:PAS domain S-box-containing protein